jgi:hypothetical protein
MPVKVVISVNDDIIETVHIARISRSASRHPDKYNDYAVLLQDRRPTPIEWLKAKVMLRHRYGDGVTVLVRRALQELEKQ